MMSALKKKITGFLFLNAFFLLGSFCYSHAVTTPVEIYRSAVSATPDSKVEFYALGKPGMLKIHGITQSIEGSLTKNNSEFSGQFTLKLDALDSGMKLRDSHMNKKVLETEKYPTAELKLKPFLSSSNEKIKFSGTLKLHGVEKEIQGDASLNQTTNQIAYTASFVVLLTDFGMQPPEFAGMSINNDVRIEVNGVAKK